MAERAITTWFTNLASTLGLRSREAVPRVRGTATTRMYQGNAARQAPDHDRMLLWAIVILLTLVLLLWPRAPRKVNHASRTSEA